MRIIILLLLLASCGGDYAVKTESEPIKVEGETYSYVVLQMEFITQMRSICEDLYLVGDFESEGLYKQEVAQCTIDNLSILDLSAIEGFNDEICNNPESEQEIQICEAIN